MIRESWQRSLHLMTDKGSIILSKSSFSFAILCDFASLRDGRAESREPPECIQWRGNRQPANQECRIDWREILRRMRYTLTK